ncbi:MAG TPA: hypothetical protein VJO99_19770 [Burkholderiaceae bacterium]|nr:hypothetical protein [Burkholderiaceae bacterium]
MTPSIEQWKVLPHGKLTEVDENILTVTGDLQMPLTHIPRRMTVVRLADGRLVIFSAVSLDESEMRELEVYGQPSFLIVPNDHHRLDAKAWKERYPAMQVIAPEGAREKVQAVVPVDTTNPRWDDPNVEFVTMPGTRGRESALVVRSRHGTTLVLNDVIGNMPSESGFGGWFLRRMGFAGDQPHIPGPVKLLMVDDKAALRRQLLQWADIASLHCILVSHGLPIDESPQQTLRELAATLT